MNFSAWAFGLGLSNTHHSTLIIGGKVEKQELILVERQTNLYFDSIDYASDFLDKRIISVILRNA